MKVIFLLLFIILGLFLIKAISVRIYYLSKFSKTYDQLDKLGLINTVSGKIGAGKSILCSCFTQLFTLKIIERLQNQMYEIERVLIEVDFAKLESIVHGYEDLSIDNLNDKFDEILNHYRKLDDKGNLYYINNLDMIYFNYIDKKDRIKLLKRWIECYLHLQRDCYVFANVRTFNHITSSYSYPFDNEWMHLKITTDFPLIKNSIFFEDDKSLYSSNLAFMKKIHEDTGSDVFMRLFRHLFEETSYYIVSLQDVSRWIKHEREISTNHVYVEKSFVVGNFKTLNFILDLVDKFFSSIYWLLKKIYKNERYYNNLNFFKKVFYKIDLFKSYLFSKSYVMSKCIIYDDIEKVGKDLKDDDPGCYKFNFVAPVYYYFANLDSHTFKEVYNYVYSKSNKKYSDLSEFIFDKEKVLAILGEQSSSSSITIPESSDKSIF